MNLNNIDNNTVKVSDFLNTIKNGDMNFQSGKDYLLYSGSVAGQRTQEIVKEMGSSNFHLAQTSQGQLIKQIELNDDGMGFKFRQAVINELAEKSDLPKVTFAELNRADKDLVLETMNFFLRGKVPNDTRFSQALLYFSN